MRPQCTYRAVLREWRVGEALALHSHPGCDVHTLVVAGALDEYVERLCGEDQRIEHCEGSIVRASDALGDHALRARVRTVTLEVTVRRAHEECVGCPASKGARVVYVSPEYRQSIARV